MLGCRCVSVPHLPSCVRFHVQLQWLRPCGLPSFSASPPHLPHPLLHLLPIWALQMPVVALHGATCRLAL